jgi:hypothetical protein
VVAVALAPFVGGGAFVMLDRLLLVTLAVAFCVTSPGCALVDSTRTLTRSTVTALQTGGNDHRDYTEERSEDWIEAVGKEARGNQPREKDPDPWFKKYVQSETARSIERNVGVD